MASFIEYLTLNTAERALMGGAHRRTNPHLYTSFIGLLVGIMLSFVVSGIEKKEVLQDSNEDKIETQAIAKDNTSTTKEITINWPKRDQFIAWIVITFLIGALTYPTLYSRLKTQASNPGLVVFLTAVEFGFFWQSVVAGVTKLAA